MARRTQDDINKIVIDALGNKELSVNEIAREVRANWSTVNRTLELLKNLSVVEETITTPKIRMFKIKN